MWLFAGVCFAISTPWFRTLLETLFAELTIIFFNFISVVAIALVGVFIAAVAMSCKSYVREVKIQVDAENKEEENEEKKSVVNSAMQFCPRSEIPMMREAQTVAKKHSASQASSFVTGNSLMKTLFFASTMLPLTMVVGAGHAGKTLTTSRHLQTNTTTYKVPFTLADNPTALEAINKKLTMCKYSKVKECIDDAKTMEEFGIYKRQPGYCSALDSAYVNVSANAAVPNRYTPTSVEDAYKAGFTNKFSEWSATNQVQFQVDCPFLYNETIATGGDYLCCTENQYSGLKTQVRQIPGLCKSCKENLRNIFCQMTCSPNNSMFFDIDQVRIMPGDDEHPGAVFPAIEEATYYVGTDWVRDIYDYCEKDSSFSLLCNPKQNCTDGFGLMEFMGSYKFNTIGSPLQINLKTIPQVSANEQKDLFCACGATNLTGCISPMDTHLTSCVGVCGSLCAVDANDKRTFHPACYGTNFAATGSSNASTAVDSKWDPLMAYMAANLVETDFDVLNYFLAMVGGVIGFVLIMGFLYITCRKKKYGDVPSAEATRPGPFVASATAEQSRLSTVDEFVSLQMKRWGTFLSSGNNPLKVIGVVLIIVIVCSIGLSKIEVETDPVKLWVSESSRPYKERDRYGELFMPFYRSQQTILVPKDDGNISRVEYLKESIRLQEMVAAVTYGPADATFPERVTLDDICWKVTGTSCTVNSITQYFQNRMDHFEFYEKYGLALDHFSQCMYSPSNSDVATCSALANKLTAGDSIPTSMSDCPCLAGFGAPMNLYNTYLGGFPYGADKNTTLFLQSKAIVSTALVYNYYDASLNDPAILWEREFIKLLKAESKRNQLFTIYFMAETSVQDEIKVESNGDMLPVVLSYTLMIIYVSLGINRWSYRKSFFQTSKISVGFLGVVCIMLAVASTIGIFMWAGVKLQLVIMEVVPFLTLAIGVDNIFLLVHAVSHKQDELRQEQPALFVGLEQDPAAAKEVASIVVSEGLGYIGPSIFMASLAESIAFAFGCISPMPAVLWFAAFACVAVAINFCLQMTLLMSVMTLDKRRELSGKYDLICWKRASAPAWTQPEASEEQILVQPKTPEGDDAHVQAGSSTLNAVHIFDWCVDAYAWFLSLRVVKLLVLLVFLFCTLISISGIEKLKHGLPQAESMPSNSYLTDYFNALDAYLATGAPVYFVVEGGYGRNPEVFDLNDATVQTKFCKSKDFCDEFAIPKIIDALANDGNRNITHFSEGTTYSWMDDFWGFVSPDSECCRVDSNNAYLPILKDNATYTAARPNYPTCLAAKSTVPPVPKESFMSLFSMFSTASAGTMCSYGGGSIYRGQFSVDDKPIPVVTSSTPQIVLNKTSYGNQITSFSYMVVSTANPTQQHFIDAYAQARRAAEWISEKTGIDVWVFSLTYVFFDQYLTVVRDTYLLVGLALAAIFVIHAIYFGGLFYPLVVALAAANIVIQVMGLMRPNDILLNGLSMVNLIIAAGIGVEFCGHYVRMFAKARGTGDERAKTALKKVLVSVLFGITITKIVGLSALTLADSRIFKKYYFRMYMMVVMCGVLNGMLLLPVLLSVFVDVKQFFLQKRQQKNEGGDYEASESPAFQGAESVKLASPAGGSGATRHSNSD
ncbi:Niemann-pick c1 protein, partial [Globisporangium splendens]